MEIRDGFKKTDVGIIPTDWLVKPIKDIGDIIRGASPRPKGDKRFYGGNVPRLMVADVTRDGKYVVPAVDSLTEEGAKRSRPCDAGTLTIVCSGTVGVVSFLAVDACIHDGFLALVNADKNVDKDYLYHQLSTLRASFDKSATHGGVFTNLTTSGVRELKVPLPSTKIEQTAIAKALSDVDALMAQQEKLITKKCQIKQGAMQTLLNPFDDNGELKDGWGKKTLGENATLKARIGWQGLTTAEYLTSGDYFLITGTEFKSGFINWDSCHCVEQERYKQDRNIQVKPKDVLVTKDGTIGKVAFIRDIPKPATLNSGVFVIRPVNEAFHPEFFYYVLMSDIFTQFLVQLCAGSTINHLYQKDFVNFMFYTPIELSEQEDIANIFSDMDMEIEGLKQKLAKTQRLKQGMMQSLLTGKVRLIDSAQ